MRDPDTPAGSRASIACGARSSSTRPMTIVDDEPVWRALPQSSVMASSGLTTVASRWHAVTKRAQEFGAETAGDYHVVKVVLRSMDIRLSLAGRTVQDGVVTPGMFHVTEPSVRAHCLFRGPYNVLHLHIPNDLIAECTRDMLGREVGVFCSQAKPAADPTVERLARALLSANLVCGSLARLYADCIGIATVARLVAVALGGAPTRQRKVSTLARWRLKRTIDWVDAHLAEPVTLAEIASAAGLTRMHFAAQFRAATGLRPHEYLLRRRVERAQDMFARTSMSIVDVALSVGFQNQSHFTRIFKRFVGEPPQSWCQSIDVERPVSTSGHCRCNARRR